MQPKRETEREKKQIEVVNCIEELQYLSSSRYSRQAAGKPQERRYHDHNTRPSFVCSRNAHPPGGKGRLENIYILEATNATMSLPLFMYEFMS